MKIAKAKKGAKKGTGYFFFAIFPFIKCLIYQVLAGKRNTVSFFPEKVACPLFLCFSFRGGKNE